MLLKDTATLKSADQHIPAWVFVGYAALLIAVQGLVPLWVDEILQLTTTRNQSVSGTLTAVGLTPGAVPLGYFIQSLFVNTLGFSLLSARFSSILFGAGTCALMAVLARRMRRHGGVIALLTFLVLPLQFRYAFEARPYGQALFFSVLATVFYFELRHKVTPMRVAAYGLAVLLGLYSQPYSIFVPLSHLLASWVRSNDEEPGASLRGSILLVMGAATILFLPWYLHTRHIWAQVIQVANGPGEAFHPSLRTPLIILREISGASYWGSGLLFLAASIGLNSPKLDRRLKTILCLLVVVPIGGALVADFVFGYFYAVRQMIFALPALALLAAAGFSFVIETRRAIGVTALGCYLAFALWYDVAWLRGPHENWQSAASRLVSEVQSACLMPIPNGRMGLYAFFEPSLERHLCAMGAERDSDVVIAEPPGPYRQALPDVMGRVRRAGLIEVSRVDEGGTTIHRFEEPGLKGVVASEPLSGQTGRAALLRERPLHARRQGRASHRG